MKLGFKIAHKSDKEKKILSAMRARFKLSERQMDNRHKKWRKAEESFIAYLPEREVDALRRGDRERGKPQYTTIVVPFTYAILMTAHTYWSTVFLARTPIFQYAARHGETRQNVQAVEALMDYQVHVGGMLPPMYIWLLDMGKYGIGICGNHWDEETITVSEIKEIDETVFNVIPTGRQVKRKVTRTIQGYQGNRLFNVKPYNWFPDTRVPLHEFQKGEFCGMHVEMGWNNLRKREEDGEYFNLKDLKMLGLTTQGMENDMSPQLDQPGQDGMLSDRELKDVDFQPLHEMYIELIPKEWGLGSGSVPEKWVFTSDRTFSVLIGARPLGCIHNRYPFSVLMNEVDGYSLNARGTPEVLEPLQQTMDWLVNSHFYNVRKVLNDQFIVDPSKLVMKDVLDPLPGGIIRMKPAAYGTDPRLTIHQLQVVDVTQNHLKDTQFIWEMAQRVIGVSDNMMGIQHPGGRKTATEVRTSSAAGINRQKTVCEYGSAVGWVPLSQMMLMNSQQYYDGEKQFKIAGDLLEATAEDSHIPVTPEDIAGFYDFIPVDGSLPVDRFAQANLWKELLMGMQKMPQVAQQYDIAGIFSWVAQLSGLKNVNQFKIKIESQEDIDRLVREGKLVPQGGTGGGQQTNRGASEPTGAENVARVSGVGPSG